MVDLRDYFAHVIVWGSLLGLVSLNIYAVLPDYQNDYQNAEIQISNILQPGDIIMGTQTFWFDFFNHPYYSWEQLVYYRRYAPYSTIEDAMIEFHPDIFIIDGQVNDLSLTQRGHHSI